jgi:hypothetical protein
MLSTIAEIPLTIICRFLLKRQIIAAFAFANHLSFNKLNGFKTEKKCN